MKLVTRRYRPVGQRQRAAVCARVSTERQIRGSGLIRQLDNCREWVERRQMCVVAEHYGWESAYTDKIEKRPLLLQLLGDAGRRLVDVVVFEHVDRAVRSVQVWHEFREQLWRYGVVICFARPEQDVEELRRAIDRLRSS